MSNLTDFAENPFTFLDEQGYQFVVERNGIYAGLYKLLFTTAIIYDLDAWGYDRRYCFEDREKAAEELSKWYNQKDLDPNHEPEGYIAKRKR